MSSHLLIISSNSALILDIHSCGVSCWCDILSGAILFAHTFLASVSIAISFGSTSIFGLAVCAVWFMLLLTSFFLMIAGFFIYSGIQVWLAGILTNGLSLFILSLIIFFNNHSIYHLVQ
jgi:hypothetical protein